MLQLVERGRIGLDDPVVGVWPELVAGAGGHLRIRHLLSHGAGLAALPPPGTGSSLLHWDSAVAALAAAEPDWPPGEGVGEHALTFGHLVGEIVRRVDGRSLGRYLAEELSGPLGLDVHVGVAEHDLCPVADTVGLTSEGWTISAGRRGRSATAPLGTVSIRLVNSTAWRRAEVPAVNGHASARGLAAFYVALLVERLPRAVSQIGAVGTDLVIGEPVVWCLAGGRSEGAEVGMGGVGGQWAGSSRRHRPGMGLHHQCDGRVGAS